MEERARKRDAKAAIRSHHWAGISLDFIPLEYEGFIYEVYYLGKLIYVGKKSFWSNISIAIPGKKRKQKVVKESNWKTYTGSSIDLNKAIRKLGKDKFIFKVVYLAKTKIDLTYYEVKSQVENDVLNHPEMLNDCILGKFYKGRVSKLDKIT
jgi:hypothetical protein